MSFKIQAAALIVAFLAFCSISQAEEKPSVPWNIHDTIGLPYWLQFSIKHRSRYETLDNAFRRGANGSDQVLAFRTTVFAQAAYENFRIGGEFIDSRIALDDTGTPVSTTLVNEVELLQAYLAWDSQDFLGTGLEAYAKGGRQTLDFGSRRLIARNRYRNTINAFTGIDFNLQETGNWQWRSFFVLPVTRLPNGRASINRGAIEFDAEAFDIYFTGTFLGLDNLPIQTQGEVYLYYLNERDTQHALTKNRDIFTPGIRWYREPVTGQFDFELETVLQVGTSRATRSTMDTTDLNHFAYFGHAALGYTFNYPWKPRFILQYDYASGDKDPNDGKNGRFETLYGARRFEFGPTSIWGAFARANISSPGYRIKIKPHQGLSVFLAHRAFWLAEKRDTWTGARLHDSTGQSGDFIGHQLEIRMRWEVAPKLATLETGWAHLFKGEFAKNAPGSPADKDDSDYFYVQTSLHL